MRSGCVLSEAMEIISYQCQISQQKHQFKYEEMMRILGAMQTSAA